MKNSNTATQTQDPPVTEISEPMVEAAARAMWKHDTGGTCWKYAAANFAPAYRASARAALAAYNERIEAERVRQRLRNPPGQKVPAEDAAQIAAWFAQNKPKKLPKRKATGPSIVKIRGALKDGRRITFTRGRSGRAVTFRKQAP